MKAIAKRNGNMKQYKYFDEKIKSYEKLRKYLKGKHGQSSSYLR